MTVHSFNCIAGYDRPDYDRIQRQSVYGTTQDRADIAERLILDDHVGVRAFDNCFEMGDGDQVVCILVSRALRNKELQEAISRDWSADQLTNGFPTRWLDTYNRIQNPLGIAA